MNQLNPLWIAPRNGHDWQDEDILNAIEWLTSTVDSRAWSKRMDVVKKNFEAGKQAWTAGNYRTQLFDPEDAIAWYVFQASAYVSQRVNWYEPAAFRIAPVFKRLGQIIPHLNAVAGAMDRVTELMINGRRQPDDGLFELLVAGAYKCRSWRNVSFVPERPGIAKTQDIVVSTGSRRWAVECKRVNRSGYEAQERDRGEELAEPVHRLCRALGHSVVIDVLYDTQLSEVSDHYLVERVEAFLNGRSRGMFVDSQARMQVRKMDLSLAHKVLKHDDVFFGSSRMLELLVGVNLPHVDYSLEAEWTPATSRPLYATAVGQASVVRWRSVSSEAAKRKARHFRTLVARATEQLPLDCPGVIHVGYEARDGNSVDQLRHVLNSREIERFDPGEVRLRWVYGHYMSPEHTTARNESLALSETTAPYKVGRHRTPEPLPNHVLFSNEAGVSGHHWKK